MTRLVVLVEGQTEEDFVNSVLSAHLYSVGYTSVRAHLLGNARQRAQSGGIVPWEIAKRDILDDLLHDRGAVVTTMVDYYAMPESWPGRAEAGTNQTAGDKAVTVEEAVLEQITVSLTNFNPRRFIPYVVMHEFEGLLFSDPVGLANSIGKPELSRQFQSIRSSSGSPEEINDSRDTCPSRRVMALDRQYQKRIDGVQAIRNIGLSATRRECPLFDKWITRLEQAAQS